MILESGSVVIITQSMPVFTLFIGCIENAISRPLYNWNDPRLAVHREVSNTDVENSRAKRIGNKQQTQTGGHMRTESHEQLEIRRHCLQTRTLPT